MIHHSYNQIPVIDERKLTNMFNKNKTTRSFILISFIYNLKIQNENNISPEIHLLSSGKSRVFIDWLALNTLPLPDDIR